MEFSSWSQGDGPWMSLWPHKLLLVHDIPQDHMLWFRGGQRTLECSPHVLAGRNHQSSFPCSLERMGDVAHSVMKGERGSFWDFPGSSALRIARRCSGFSNLENDGLAVSLSVPGGMCYVQHGEVARPYLESSMFLAGPRVSPSC